jgi:2'-5' RNA ligase
VKRATRERTKQKKSVLAYWLAPAKPERDLFEEIIRILATQLDAPVFQPHLTICVTHRSRNVKETLKQIDAEAIRLRVRDVSFSNRYTKTLFVRFHESRYLDELNASLRRAAKLPVKALRDPHLSLLYKRMPMSAKRELASTIRLPFREVVFDSIEAVQCVSPTETPADVKSWRVIATKKLRR